jgi:hypothetical protein
MRVADIPILILLLGCAFLLGCALTGLALTSWVGTRDRREVVDVDLTGRHPDRSSFDEWADPPDRVPLGLRVVGVPKDEPKDAA